MNSSLRPVIIGRVDEVDFGVEPLLGDGPPAPYARATHLHRPISQGRTVSRVRPRSLFPASWGVPALCKFDLAALWPRASSKGEHKPVFAESSRNPSTGPGSKFVALSLTFCSQSLHFIDFHASPISMGCGRRGHGAILPVCRSGRPATMVWQLLELVRQHLAHVLAVVAPEDHRVHVAEVVG